MAMTMYGERLLLEVALPQSALSLHLDLVLSRSERPDLPRHRRQMHPQVLESLPLDHATHPLDRTGEDEEVLLDVVAEEGTIVPALAAVQVADLPIVHLARSLPQPLHLYLYLQLLLVRRQTCLLLLDHGPGRHLPVPNRSGADPTEAALERDRGLRVSLISVSFATVHKLIHVRLSYSGNMQGPDKGWGSRRRGRGRGF